VDIHLIIRICRWEECIGSKLEFTAFVWGL
jgi:hypothetical protein